MGYSKPLGTLQYQSIIKRSAATAVAAVAVQMLHLPGQKLYYRDVVTNVCLVILTRKARRK